MAAESDWLLAKLRLFTDGDRLITSMGASFKDVLDGQECKTVMIGNGEYTDQLAKELKTDTFRGHIPVYVQFLGARVPETLSPDRVFAEMPDILGGGSVVAHTLFFVPPERREAVLERFRTLPGDVSTPPQTHREALVTELPSQQIICVVLVGRIGYQPSRG